MKSHNLSLNPAILAFGLAFLFALDPALAASGTKSVQNIFQQILDILQPATAVVAAVAICWGAYKMMYQSASIQHLYGPVGGCIVAAMAVWIANQLVG